MSTKTVNQVLREALALIKKGWTRKREWIRRGEKECYCALGAVHQVSGVPDRYDAARLYNRAIDALYRALPPEFSVGAHNIKIAQFNDSRHSKKEVIALFERAIKDTEGTWPRLKSCEGRELSLKRGGLARCSRPPEMGRLATAQ